MPARYLTGSTFLGALFGIAAGAALSVVFALLTLGLAVNQVATGLALTILGVGLSGLIGAGFVGERIALAPHLYIPVLTDLPFVGHILFGQDAFVYFSIALVAGDLVVPLPHARRADPARGRRQPHLGACARLSGAQDTLAGGAVRRRLRRARRRLSAARLYAVLHSGMTAGRGWIALALVVFSSWRPRRLVGGAYLFGAVTILQLHAQALGLGIPSQLMSALPYLATVIVLVLISRTRGTAGSAAPASLGMVFVPDR